MAQVGVVTVCVYVITHVMQECVALCYRVASVCIHLNARLGSCFAALVLLWSSVSHLGAA